MKDFYDWMEVRALNEGSLKDFSTNILNHPTDYNSWLIAADWADDNDLFSGVNLIRIIAILMQRGMDAAEEIAKETGTENNPSGRMKLINNCVSHIPWFDSWRKLRPDLSPFLYSGIVPDELNRGLGSGSNIADWEIEFNPHNGVTTCLNDLETRDEGGGHYGWMPFSVNIPPINPINFEIEFNQQGIEENEEVMDAAFAEEFVTHEIHWSLSKYLGHS